MSLGLDLLVNIAGGSALLFIAWAVQVAVRRVRTRGSRRLWRYLQSDLPLGLALTVRDGPLARSTPRLSLAEARVVVDIIPTLLRLGINYELLDPSRDNQSMLGDRGLLVLGGPASNGVAAHAMLALQPVLPLKLQIDPAAILIADRSYEPEYDPKTGRVVRDYGMVIRCHNVFDATRSHWSVHIMGCHGFGTEGAARCLRDETLSRELLVKSGDAPFVAIVEVDCRPGVRSSVIREVFLIPGA